MEKMQFDKSLGGTYDLPRSVTLIDFLTARAPELAALNHAIENAVRDKPLYLRNPPNHMRRKLLSHNQNRLPRKVLEAIKKKKMKEISCTKAQNINALSKKQKTKKKNPDKKNKVDQIAMINLNDYYCKVNKS
ncbi:hypothetical protein PV327_000109 [Microctonus hyperodae]|uniref:Pop1 N-terminal domain-containing protein n=1 Tax=Microctonus hyperodae TaxID=165561 RepID=A0AA39L1Z8_MICHY|nr:hypothetical protein PV327_000109 [Microctonus hyperodae]